MNSRKILISAKVASLIALDSCFSQREGFDIEVYADSHELLEQARRQKPDIIYLCPACSKDDRTCYRLLNEDSRIDNIPVVAVVDSSRLNDLVHVKHERPADVLFTPVSPHMFLASARRILGLAARAFPRQQTSLLIHFGSDIQQLKTACAFNLSTGGVFIASDDPPALDSAIHIQLDILTSEEPILCQGVVTWHNNFVKPTLPEMPAGFGVQFASLKIADLFAIRTFIEELSKIGSSQIEY